MSLATLKQNPAIATLGMIAAILLSVGLLLMGNGLQGMLLPIRAEMENFSAMSIGLLGTGYFGGFVLGCLYTPRLIAKVGHIRTFTALVAVASVCVLGFPIALQPVVWILFRALTGACLAGLYLVIESWLNEKADNTNRGFVMSSYIVVNFTVITLGQLLVMVYDPASFVLFTIASILVSLAAVPIALTATTQPDPPPVTPFRPRKMYEISPVGMICCALIGMAQGAFWTLTPVFAQAQGGGSLVYASFFMSAAVAGGALAQYPLGRWSDRLDRRVVLMMTCWSALVFGLLIATLGFMEIAMPFWAGMLLALGFGASALPSYALAAAHAFDFAEKKDFVELSSGLLLVNGLGAAIGPFLAATMMQFVGMPALFLFHASMQVLMIVYLTHRLRQRKAPVIHDKTAFDLGATAAIPTALAVEDLPSVPRRRRFRLNKPRP